MISLLTTIITIIYYPYHEIISDIFEAAEVSSSRQHLTSAILQVACQDRPGTARDGQRGVRRGSSETEKSPVFLPGNSNGKSTFGQNFWGNLTCLWV